MTKQPDMLTCVIAPPSLSIVSLSLYSLTLMHCNFFMPTSLHASTAWRQLLDNFSRPFDYNQFSFSFATRTEIICVMIFGIWYTTEIRARKTHRPKVELWPVEVTASKVSCQMWGEIQRKHESEADIRNNHVQTLCECSLFSSLHCSNLSFSSLFLDLWISKKERQLLHFILPLEKSYERYHLDPFRCLLF